MIRALSSFLHLLYSELIYVSLAVHPSIMPVISRIVTIGWVNTWFTLVEVLLAEIASNGWPSGEVSTSSGAPYSLIASLLVTW